MQSLWTKFTKSVLISKIAKDCELKSYLPWMVQIPASIASLQDALIGIVYVTCWSSVMSFTMLFICGKNVYVFKIHESNTTYAISVLLWNFKDGRS